MALVIVVAAVYLFLCAWVWPYTMDDSFISFRYAKHIGDGIGPIWNLADIKSPVEGYTSFLHVWLLGGVRFISGADVELAGKVLGVLAGLLLLVSVAREIHRYQIRGIAAFVAFSFMVLPFTALNSVSGMETALFMLLNWLCAMACVRLLDAPSKSATWLFVLFGLLGTLTRPEFGAPFLLMAAYVWWQRPVLRTTLLQAILVLYVLPGIAITGWRYSYYGQFLPNPFYAKQTRGLSYWGVVYVVRFIGFCALPYFILTATAGRSLWKNYRDLMIIVSLNLGFACAYFTTTVPLMGWWFRYLLPQLPLLAFCAAVALKHREPAGWSVISTWRAAAAGLILLVNLAYVPVIARFLVFHRVGEERYREIGRRLGSFATENRWLLFYDVGSLVYESEWNTVDVVGLNTERRKLKTTCEMKTDLVLQASDSPGYPCPSLYRRLVDLPFIKQEPEVDRYMRVYVRNDITYGDQLKQSLVTNWPPQFTRQTDWVARYAYFARSLGPFFSLSQ